MRCEKNSMGACVLGLMLTSMLLPGVGIADLDAQTSARLDAAMAGKHRSDANRARDSARKPKETLDFFGFRHDMTVVEAWPGTGWYTEILAPVLKGSGKLYAAHYDLNPSYGYNGVQQRFLGQFLQMVGSDLENFGEVEIRTLYFPYQLDIAPRESVDLVLTFRNFHNWVVPGYGGETAAVASLMAMYNALKPGGVLGVVDHRWPDPATEDPAARNGYVSEERVIALAEKAGFKLAARSDMHRNPKDSHDHPAGVWTLPPSLALGDENRAHYSGIGESDRMTLKFVKPVE